MTACSGITARSRRSTAPNPAAPLTAAPAVSCGITASSSRAPQMAAHDTIKPPAAPAIHYTVRYHPQTTRPETPSAPAHNGGGTREATR